MDGIPYSVIGRLFPAYGMLGFSIWAGGLIGFADPLPALIQ